MCIVIDTNAFSPVFNEKCKTHADFAPVKKWIEAGGGKLVYGGNTYKEELKRTSQYMNLVLQLRTAGKAVAIVDAAVDALEQKVRELTKDTDCDDQHLIALLDASRCRLLCSQDASSCGYIKKRKYYPNGLKDVKIYSSRANKDLLKDRVPVTSLKNVVQ